VHQVINDRLLSESEYLPSGAKLLVKEIIIDLGFADHAHFAYFFRREKGITPSQFLQKMHGLQENTTSSK